MQDHASFSVPGVFSDHMVVQRQRPIPVWGRADSNAEVDVTLAGQSRTAKADAAGAWKVAFDPVATPGPHTLEIRAGNESLRITDVLVGEVWLCSGQSNMGWVIANSLNAAEEIKAVGK